MTFSTARAFLAQLLYPLFFFLIFSTFMGHSANGQILNIEKNRLDRDSAKVFLFKLGGNFNIFNRSSAAGQPVNLLGYNGSLDVAYHAEKHRYVGIGNINFLRINDSPFLNFGFIHLRANWFFRKRLQPESYVQSSYDNFRRLDPRMLVGSGIRYRLVDGEKFHLILGVGGMYEYEAWRHPQDNRLVEVSFLKSANYVVVRYALNEYLDFNWASYYQVGYDRGIAGFRNRLSTTANLNSKVSERFSINNRFELSYEDKPIIPITKIIFNYTVGMSLSF